MVDRLGARRGSLPIPDRQHLGLITYDAKDPDTTFAPIEPLLRGMQEFVTEATTELTPGSHQVRAEFACDGGRLAKGGKLTLFYSGASVGSGRIAVTQPLVFSADETTYIGNDYGMVGAVAVGTGVAGSRQ